MPQNPRAATPAATSFTAVSWDERHPFAHQKLAGLVADARVLGIGESAHFIAELGAARAALVAALVPEGVANLALEIGHDEAPLVEQWLAGERPEELQALVGTLTTALYGAFLADLRRRLPSDRRLHVMGVDLPNSSTIDVSLEPLAEAMVELDPAAVDLVQATRELASQVVGGSAAASASSWLALDSATQDSITVHLTRLRARVDALGTVHARAGDSHRWGEARRLIDTAATTEVMLRAMADLFTGTGRTDDTTIREVFVARRVAEELAGLPGDGRIAYVAHNNHIQKAPVLFDGVLTAYPAGSLLADMLGSQYRAIALSHAAEDVPEMSFPASTDVGFRVERVTAAPLGEHSVEAAAASVLLAQDAAVVEWDDLGDAPALHLRSQSATTEAAATAFDAALVFATATTDEAVRSLGLD